MSERRFWTDDERVILRRLYRKAITIDIAKRLSRTTRAIHHQADLLGLVEPKTRIDARFLAKLKQLHARGWTDSEIANELGCARRVAGKYRRHLGLPSNRVSAHYRARVAAKTREQCKAAGVASLAEVRALAFRSRARRAGWPEDLPPRAIEILDALESRGPLTRREIADAIGMEWHGSRASLKARGNSTYLAELMDRGLVVSLGKVVRGTGRGHSVQLYSLALVTERSMA